MARAPFSLKSTHLLMWSSPILLVVLVFTLTSATSPKGPAASSRPPSSKSPVTTTLATPTSVTTTPQPHRTAQNHRRPPVTTTTTLTPSAVTNYSVVTTTTVRRINSVPNASAMNGESSGTLGPGFEVVDVPLQGPGDWALSTSAPTNQSLQCGAQSSPVFQQVVVGATQSCQLEISSTSSGASLTWQLTPIT
jgi:hypothetical protein